VTLVRLADAPPSPRGGEADEQMVVERGGRYKSRAEIRNVTIGADGLVRLNLLFLDGSVPDELLPPTPPEPAASTT
jgi:prepilin-type processing-associated H-X9-DG protein